MITDSEIEDRDNKIIGYVRKGLEAYVESKAQGYRVDDWDGGRLFMRYYESMIEKVWLREKRISCEYLSAYDRYILEFDCLLYNPKYSMLLPAFKLTVYDRDLNIVYSLKDRMRDADSKDMYKRLWELEYWLSLDWKEAIDI